MGAARAGNAETGWASISPTLAQCGRGGIRRSCSKQDGQRHCSSRVWQSDPHCHLTEPFSSTLPPAIPLGGL